MCCTEHWDTRTLDEKIDKQLYLQTALSRKPEEVIKKELEESKSKNQLLPDMVFRSSYFLDILGLPDVFSEKDLENAILGQVEEFLSELGSDFTFVKRQKRITVDAVMRCHLILFTDSRKTKEGAISNSTRYFPISIIWFTQPPR